jgi:serine/threonine protein kinase
MPELPQVGDEFAGYRLRAVLGRGGMSVVYQAENPRLGNVIALKVLAPELAADDAFRARFLEESRIAAAMNHPHVIPIHDTGSSDGLLYIAMRYVSGTDLRQMISKRGCLQPDTAIYLLSQAARALDAAHRRGLVHRDVKPGNLLVEHGNDDPDPDHLYLADFGITKPARGGSTGLTSTGQFLGTVDYVAPEQVRGLEVLGLADQYSLGCVLYECLTGRVPFEQDVNEAIIWAQVEEHPAPPTMLRPGLPHEVDEVFAQVLAKQPGDRYEDCRAFIAAARDALGPLAAGPPASRAPHPALPVGYPEVAHDPGAGSHPRAGSIIRPDPPPSEGMVVLSAPAPADYQAAAPYQDPAPAPAWTPHQPGGSHQPGRSPQSGGSHQPGRSPQDGAGGAAGPGGSGGQPASDGHARVRGDLRVPLLVLAAAVLIAAGAGIGTAIGLSRQRVTATMAAAAGPVAARSASPAPAAAVGLTATPPVSALETALEPVQNFTGRLSLAACKFPSATFATCTNPDPKGAVASATFQTFPSLNALYTAYQATVAAMADKPFSTVENTQNCGKPAPQPMGEISWNHSDQHTLKYSVAQIASGTVPQDIAAGRMFCLQLAGGGENIVWTQNYGNLLVVAHGAVSHEQVWLWFVAVHHNVAFKGQPAMAGMSMPASASASASAPASASPKAPMPSATAQSSATALPSSMKSGMKMPAG